MLGQPINDTACLSKVTEAIAAASERDDVRNLADRFPTTRELAAWIRKLPQRNDLGVLDDGPRITCDVSQRLRIPADDPNCVERSALYWLPARSSTRGHCGSSPPSTRRSAGTRSRSKTIAR